MDLYKKSREELIEIIEKQQIAGLFESAFDLVQVFDEQGSLLFVNKAWLDAMDYPEAGLTSLNFFDLLHPQYGAAARSLLQRVRKEGHSEKFKTVLMAKNGSQVYVSGTISWQYKNNTGEFRAIFHDISEQVKAERAQRLYNSITNLTMQSADLDQLYGNIHRELKKVMDAASFYIALSDERKRVSFSYHTGNQDQPPGQDHASEGDLVDYVISTNQAHILYEEDILELITATVIRPQSAIPQIWLGVPLTVNQRVIGLIAVQHFERRQALDEKDLDLLSFVSGQVAMAIERKRYEERFSEQTSRLNAIFESSSHLIWSVDRLFRLTTFNQNFVQIMHHHFQVRPKLHSVYSKKNQQVTEAYLRQFREKYERAFEGRSSQFEMEFKLGPDHYIWKQVFINPVFRADGSIREVSGIAHDVTQRKKSEIALLESEEKFRDIFESFQDIYFRCHIDGTLTMVSPSVSELTDFKTSDVLGKNVTNYYLYDSRTKNLIKRLVKNKSVRNFEATVIKADGSLLQCICNVRLIHYPDRAPEIEGIARDITELKKATAALQKAKDVAEKSLKVKEAFLANMSHEIRTPMNGIISMIDVLAETKLSEQQADYVQTIKSSSETLLNILNDILDLSKIEAGKMQLHRTPVSLRQVLEKTHRLFQHRASGKNISFTYTWDEDLPTYLWVDEVRLLQILSNLVANALKFTSESGEVTLRAADMTHPEKRREPDAEHLIRIEVIDTGIGISETDQKNLFQNFSQADSSFSKKYEGTGLGLSIARQLIQLMQGDIGVSSQVGQGSTFYITFRAKPAAAPAAPAEADPPKSFRQGLHILLVDDNAINRKVSGEILKNAGCQVTVTASGAEAIRQVQQHTFDLILMDIQMPEMDGIATTQALKKLGLRLPPVVAMTAYSMEGDREKFLQAGLDDYIAKPIRAKALLHKVAVLTGGDSNVDKAPVQNEKEFLVLDEDILNDLRKFGGEPLIQDSLMDFEQEAQMLIHSCLESLKAEDYDNILSSLHTLKGTASTLGIQKVAGEAKRIEAKLKAGNTVILAQDLLSLQASFAEFQNHLSNILKPNYDVR